MQVKLAYDNRFQPAHCQREALDIRQLGQVHRLLKSYDGEDRFSLYLVDGERRIQLDFPNDTTGYCTALERELVEMLGAGAVKVEDE